MDDSHLDFELADDERFLMLQSAFDALRNAKAGDFTDPDDEYWLTLFDETALKHFWWPTPDDVADWQRRWESTPVPERFTDPSLKTPWQFTSMLDAFCNGDYTLIAIDRTSSTTGRLRFDPLAYPYGGTGCMHALVECFGGLITGEAGT